MSDSNWKNDRIQFPRLLAEIDMCGGLTDEQMHAISDSTDLSWGEINELFERAQAEFDRIKDRI